jgi:hypothetical protein
LHGVINLVYRIDYREVRDFLRHGDRIEVECWAESRPGANRARRREGGVGRKTGRRIGFGVSLSLACGGKVGELFLKREATHGKVTLGEPTRKSRHTTYTMS